MKKHHRHTALVLGAVLALAACNSSTNSTPSPSPSPQIANMSGDYTGTMTDSVGGSGSVNATFAQHGASAGGAMTDAETSATIVAQTVLTVTSSNAISGAMIVDFANGMTCTFSTTGTYSNNGSTSAQIAGSYTAVTNCPGGTGTFTLTQQCTDTITSVDRRTMTYPPAC
jgi:hypothetical protein